MEAASGWAAFVSGLPRNETALDDHRLLYDSGLEWEGGTPGWIEATFVATQILQSMPPVEDQHDYVLQLQECFVKKMESNFSAKQLEWICRSKSNTLSIPINPHQEEGILSSKLPYG